MTITVNYESSVPTAAQTAFNQVVALFESLYQTPFSSVNVPIDVAFGNTGLGQSATNEAGISYSSWRDHMIGASGVEVNNPYLAGAVTTLPSTSPLTGSTSGDVVMQDALAEVLGYTIVSPPAYFSTLTFSDYQTFEYTGTATSGAYDFMNVAEHELDEALGIGSMLNGASSLAPQCEIDATSVPCYTAEDYFRYNSSGARDVTLDASAAVYFSYNGTTDVAQFNQTQGADLNDWIYGNAGCPAASPGPYIQDAYGCSGTALQYTASSPEAVVMQTLGYQLTAPEPGTILLLGAGLIGLGLLRRRR